MWILCGNKIFIKFRYINIVGEICNLEKQEKQTSANRVRVMASDPTRTKPIPGPHHCVAISLKTQEWIFRALFQQVDLLGGSISRAELEGLEQAFSHAIGPKFEIGTNSFNYCSNSKFSRDFDKNMIFRGIMGPYMSDILPMIFPEQYVQNPKKWTYICSSFIEKVIEEKFSCDIFDKYFNLYLREITKKHEKVSISDMLADQDIICLTRSVMVKLHKLYVDQEKTIADELCAKFNHHVRKQPLGSDTYMFFIKNRQMAKFLKALYSAGPSNKFRSTVLDGLVPQFTKAMAVN